MVPVRYIILTLLLLLPTAAHAAAEEVDITAESAILIEASTGRVIYEKDADSERPPASLTKIMTALLSIENLGPNSEVFITPNAATTEDVPLGINAGDRLTADELTSGMMMVSDNGAAVAIAEDMDTTVGAFAERMNKKAKELGMKSTHFANPNGLPDSMHYSTARDMARLTQVAMQNDSFQSMVSRVYGTIYWRYPRGQYLAVKNTNDLLETYRGIKGVKTGYTNAAGGCLSVAAERKGVKLIAVVLHSASGRDRFTDAERLLDYGFSKVRMVRGIEAKKAARKVYVAGGESGMTMAYPVSDVEYPIIDGEDPAHYSIKYDLPSVVKAPVLGQDPVGRLLILYDGKTVGAIDMKAERVEKGFSIGSLMVSIFGWALG